jgi:hypothetical protein
MKKFILITALIGLFLTPAFSQINGHIKRDQLLGDLSGFRYPQPFIWSDSTGFKSPLNRGRFHHDPPFPNYNEKKFFDRQISFGGIVPERSLDGMMCFRPRGYFPMPVVKPDPSVRYSLLIKRY